MTVVEAVTARGEAARARLLDAAGAELVARGGRFEVADVARRAGASPALLYRYFGSKDGLVAAVVNDFWDRYDAAAFKAPIDAPGGWRKRERERVRREVEFLYADPLAAVVLGQLQEPAGVAVDAERLARQIEDGARNYRAGQSSGELDASVNPELAAAAGLGAFRHLLGHALARRRRPSRERVIDLALRLSDPLFAAPGETSNERGEP